MSPFVRTTLRLLGWLLAVLGALPVLLYATLFLVNLNDDPLSPDVEKLLHAAPPQIDASTNGYFAWIGILGPENEPPHAWGQRWFDAALKNDEQAHARQAPVPHPFENVIQSQKQNASKARPPCDNDHLETCLAVVAANPEAARQSLQKGSVILDRGDVTLRYPAYQEPWRPAFSLHSDFPPGSPAWTQLSLTRFALAAAESRHAEALDQLQREMDFLKRQMQGSISLVDKLISFGNLHQRYLLLSQYMRRYPVETILHAERIAPMLATLPSDATRLQPGMQSEKRMAIIMLLSLKNNASPAPLASMLGDSDGSLNSVLVKLAEWFLIRPTFLVNHTINETVARYDAWIRADDLKDDAYRQALIAAQRTMPKREAFPFRLRNPVGYILMNVESPDFRQYYLRRDNLLALRNLVAFQFALAQRAIFDSDRIAATLNDSRNDLRHPYSGDVPVWDTARRQLRYTLVEGNSRNQRVAIQL